MAFFDRLWNAVDQRLFAPMPDAGEQATVREVARTAAPVIWVLGKSGAGKTSLIAALTGDSRAEVGQGFEPCTRAAAFYDFPAEVPLVRFLDTRGLEEAGYRAAEDIAWCEGQAHLVLAAMRVSDANQQAVVAVLREARRRHRDWPIIVAQTGLHERYPTGTGHPGSYPYAGTAADETDSALPHPLRQAIAFQRRLVADLPGPAPRFVPLDFTQPEDGFAPVAFGIEALLAAIGDASFEAAEALRLATRQDAAAGLRAASQSLILGYATAAAGAGALPIPLLGIGGLASANALLLRGLARRAGLEWTRATFAQFTGAIGGGALLWWGASYGIRELLKLIPLAGSWLGGTLNAGAAFSVTFGLGQAACVWLGYRQSGQEAPRDAVRRAFAEGLAEGFRQRRRAPAPPPAARAGAVA